MQAPPPATNQPTAQGSFSKTPFPHLLIYALERGLSGSFELHGAGTSRATILVIQGFPAKLRLTEAVHFLGDVMLELGLVSAEAVKASQERMAESPRLQGQIMIELALVDEARLAAGLRAQLERKLEHLFALPAETEFSYYDGVDSLARFGGQPTPIDPLPVLWRGVRQVPSWEHVDGTLRRVGAAAVRIASNAQLERFQFTRVEGAAIELLRQPQRVVDLANAKTVGPSVAQLLVYLLVITKQVELVEVGALPDAASAVGVPPDPPTTPLVPSSTGRLPPAFGSSPGPPTGQAFARVQLQAKPIPRNPLIVEEPPATYSAGDGRISSPLPQAIPLPDVPPPAASSGLGLDIGAMITTSILSSTPPSLPEEEATPQSLPPASMPPPSPRSMPPQSQPPMPPEEIRTSSSQQVAAVSALTPEQSGLKQKIIERAAQISAQDYFQMLGLDRTATPEMVQKSFIALAKVWHPDRLPAALIDVKDACSKVFTYLTEAQATLCDAERKQQYMTLLKDGGATPDDQAKIQAILEAATEFQKAEIVLKRNDTVLAYELAKRAYELDPEQADYLAMVTWLDAQKPEWLGREKTLEKISVLDGCIKTNAHSERAYFWRGMLYKRIDDGTRAYKDFKKASELNPRNLDAAREVRLYVIRGGPSKPPPGPGGSSIRPGKPAAPSETLGGLFGKLFKK